MSPIPWERVTGPVLAQGDLLFNVPLPLLPQDPEDLSGEEIVLEEFSYDLIVLSQSCDLDPSNGGRVRATNVVTCPFYTVAGWEEKNPIFAKQNIWKELAKGRRPGAYLIPPFDSESFRDCWVVDFRQIYTPTHSYLSKIAESQEARWRLQSPWVEHMSQAFALLFMRVALPLTAVDGP